MNLNAIIESSLPIAYRWMMSQWNTAIHWDWYHSQTWTFILNIQRSTKLLELLSCFLVASNNIKLPGNCIRRGGEILVADGKKCHWQFFFFFAGKGVEAECHVEFTNENHEIVSQLCLPIPSNCHNAWLYLKEANMIESVLPLCYLDLVMLTSVPVCIKYKQWILTLILCWRFEVNPNCSKELLFPPHFLTCPLLLCLLHLYITCCTLNKTVQLVLKLCFPGCKIYFTWPHLTSWMDFEIQVKVG